MAIDNSNRVRLGKRIVRDPKTGIYRGVTVFGDPEPEEEVRQIRTFHPGPLPEPEPVIELPAYREPLVVTPSAATVAPEPVAVEQPVKKKRIWKPRPNRNQKKKAV